MNFNQVLHAQHLVIFVHAITEASQVTIIQLPHDTAGVPGRKRKQAPRRICNCRESEDSTVRLTGSPGIEKKS